MTRRLWIGVVAAPLAAVPVVWAVALAVAARVTGGPLPPGAAGHTLFFFLRFGAPAAYAPSALLGACADCTATAPVAAPGALRRLVLPAYTYTRMRAGDVHSCAIRTDGTLASRGDMVLARAMHLPTGTRVGECA
ncbi:hypothetical protein tb265_39730 [Gemmatimonadetes bacterium T265]|nr:hypothetical protein tb265_39730 [Gemmatimonadetes bacterium T265]